MPEKNNQPYVAGMLTEVATPTKQTLQQAASILVQGGTVAFPTETVYGLAANALDSNAVARIFAIKGRQIDNPLIVHVCNCQMINDIAHVNSQAKRLIQHFMPGSLTLVLPKKGVVPSIVTAGLDTVAVRMPDSEVALRLIEYAGVPLAAPSANLSTRPSPTTAQAVYNDLNGRIPLIIDGGACVVGIESTVLSIVDTPTILRQGIVTPSQIQNVLQTQVQFANPTDMTVNSPGVRYKHYSPSCKVALNTNGNMQVVKQAYTQLSNKGFDVAIMCLDEYVSICSYANTLSLGANAHQAAKVLYHCLLHAEKICHYLLVVWTDTSEVGQSVFNRLSKACGGKLINSPIDIE